MKKNEIFRLGQCCLLICLILQSCYKNETKFYEDEQSPGLSIFSDKANNVMSCYINDKPWRTNDRIFRGGIGVFGGTHYEVYFNHQITTSTQDTLMITWYGRFENDSTNTLPTIRLVLPVSKSFSYTDFNSFQGKRLTVDTTNGYFSFSNASSYNVMKGSGTIYFHFAELDTVATGIYTGRMSGIFEADFGSIKINKARFDHSIDDAQLGF